jgi:antirestriction protein ArdC
MNDLYREITDRIVAALECGTPPWVRPWSSVPGAIPMNAQTRRQYRGVNFTLLSLQAAACGYEVNRWLTYRQANELGGQVRRGEQGATVVFWQLRKIRLTAETRPQDEDPSELPDRVYPLLRCYTVFNLAQIDGLPQATTAVVHPACEPEARSEDLLLMSGADIRHGGSNAFYQPSTDEIHLPPRQAFSAAGLYYATALHELTHWTSHSSRCNRQLGQRFGDGAYAAEELIAEMGSAFLCAHCRIDGQLQHASYLDHWLKVLRADKRAIFVASTKAQQAADYVLNLADPTRAHALAA